MLKAIHEIPPEPNCTAPIGQSDISMTDISPNECCQNHSVTSLSSGTSGGIVGNTERNEFDCLIQKLKSSITNKVREKNIT